MAVALSVLVATLPLMRTPPARAHGGAKPVMAAPDLAPATDEPIVLAVVEAGGYRLAGTVMQEDQLEIEIDRPIDPPDPLLGAYGPASDLAVTITLLQGTSPPHGSTIRVKAASSDAWPCMAQCRHAPTAHEQHESPPSPTP